MSWSGAIFLGLVLALVGGVWFFTRRSTDKQVRAELEVERVAREREAKAQSREDLQQAKEEQSVIVDEVKKTSVDDLRKKAKKWAK